jgi:HK97 family phage major capsid protein
VKEVLERKAREAKQEVQAQWQRVEQLRADAEADYTDEKKAAYDEAYGQYEEAKTAYDKLDSEFKTELQREVERLNAKNGGNSSRPGEAKGFENLTPGERFVQSKQYQHQFEAKTFASGPFRPLEDILLMTSDEFVKGINLKTLVTSEGAPGDDVLRATRLPGILPLLRAPLTLLDLFSTGTSDGNAIEWVRIATENNAAAVVPEATSTTDDAALKPESGLTVDVETTTYKNIAHYIPATRQSLEDMAEMQTLINNFLIDGVRRELLDQAINGNDLDGIYDVAGLSYTVSGSVNAIEAAFRGVQAVRNAFHEPTAIAMHPNDWTDMRLARDDSGAGAGTGGYLFGPPSQAGAETLWGIRVVVDPALTQGRMIVGEWDEATLYSKGGVRLHTTDSHADWFRRNIIAILAEGRFALVTRRPNAFCVVSHSDY